MNTRTFLKTLCLVPIGAVVENLPGQGVATVSEVTSFDVSQKLIQAKQMYSLEAQRHTLNEIIISVDGKRTMTVSRRYFSEWGNGAILNEI